MEPTFDGTGRAVSERHRDETCILADPVGVRSVGHRVGLPFCARSEVAGDLSENPDASTEHVVAVDLR